MLVPSRIEEWHAESSDAVQSTAGKIPLSAIAVSYGSEESAVRDSVGHASGCSEVDFRVAGNQCRMLHLIFVFSSCLIVQSLVLAAWKNSTLRLFVWVLMKRLFLSCRMIWLVLLISVVVNVG